jgi:hypothetical protein
MSWLIRRVVPFACHDPAPSVSPCELDKLLSLRPQLRVVRLGDQANGDAGGHE